MDQIGAPHHLRIANAGLRSAYLQAVMPTLPADETAPEGQATQDVHSY